MNGTLFKRLGLLLLITSTVSAEVHRVTNETNHHTFSPHHPVLARIKPGDTVITKTVDSAGWDDKGIRRTRTHGNPLTGPFFVEGAEPGDGLVVSIERVSLNRNWGYSAYRISTSALTAGYVEQDIYPNRYKEDVVLGGPENFLKGRADLVPWDIDVDRQRVRLREPVSAKVGFEFMARPMLGCIGVPPAGHAIPSSGPTGPYGGNMDYWEVRQGATIYLPVYHPGGLLYLGDGHALQGHAETVGSGVETSMDVEFRVDVRKSAGLTGIRIVNQEYLISVGNRHAGTLNEALQIATTDMIRWLTQDYGLEPWAAHLLIGFQGEYDIPTLAGTVALKIPKAALQR